MQGRLAQPFPFEPPRSERVVSHRPMNSTQLSGDPPFQLSTKIGLLRLAACNGGSVRRCRPCLPLPLCCELLPRRFFISLQYTAVADGGRPNRPL